LRDTLLPLLAHPRLQDPRPERPGGGTETVDWADPTPGDLRVDYVLPAAELRVVDAGVHWPLVDGEAALASAHRIVWVDVEIGPP
ncbi:MAG: endonuclease/exonuclease/phosphatase family protein, partial [Pseudomonadota bacterium]